MQKHVTYIVSGIDKAIAFEWITERISSDIRLSFILLNNSDSHLENFLKEKKIDFIRIPVNGKKSYLNCIIKCYRYLKKHKTSVVHCHLRDANIIGLTAAYFARIKKRIYTRHHSTYHLDYFPKAVKIDKYCNRLATEIIAISNNVANVLSSKENVDPNKIKLIHHGFDLDKFQSPDENKILELRKKYIPENSGIVVGVIARYINWKGHKYIIKSFDNLLKTYPDIHFIFANASGPDQSTISKEIEETLPSSNYTEIVFENDLFSLYYLFDYYVHTPINNEIEAFGQTYIESLASGVPMICTLSGIGNEIIKDGINALVVPYKNSIEISEAITRLMHDPELSNNLIESGKSSITQFNLNTFVEKLNSLYLK